MDYYGGIMTLVLLLKLLEIAPTAIKEAEADIAKMAEDPDTKAKIADAIKTVEDQLDNLKSLLQ